MALTAELENLVKELEKVDPVAAKAQRDLLEKHDSLQKFTREGVMRQSDYDRKMNEGKAKIDGYDKAVKDREDTVTEWRKNYEIHQQLLKDHGDLQKKVTTLEADLQAKAAAAAAVSNEDPNNPKVDPLKIADAVRERIKGEYVSTSDMSKIIAEETGKQMQSARDEFFNKTFPESALWIDKMVDAKMAYREEFGKSLPREEFAKFLKDNKIVDPSEGYERFVSPQRTEKKINDEVSKRVDEEIKKRNTSDFPGSSGAPQPMGALQVRLAKREEGDPLIPKDAELGDGTLAMAAAAELRKGA